MPGNAALGLPHSGGGVPDADELSSVRGADWAMCDGQSRALVPIAAKPDGRRSRCLPGGGSPRVPANSVAPRAPPPSALPPSAPRPSPAPTLSRIARIDVGDMTACAVASDGKAWCWGPNAHGQLGTGEHLNSTVPVATAREAREATVRVAPGTSPPPCRTPTVMLSTDRHRHNAIAPSD